jgi:hypothetical protein
MPSRHLSVLLAGLLLAGCSSGVTIYPVTGLDYVDPAGTGWRLVKDASSTSTRVVLNLVGPAGLNSRGAGFNLRAPATVRFGAFAETGQPNKAGGVYELKRYVVPTNDPLEPVLVAGGVKPGNLLTVATFQKDRRASAKDSGAMLFQIAIEFDPAAGLRAGDPVPLSVVKAKYMPQDIGVYNATPTAEMKAKAVLLDMSIALGALTAG